MDHINTTILDRNEKIRGQIGQQGRRLAHPLQEVAALVLHAANFGRGEINCCTRDSRMYAAARISVQIWTIYDRFVRQKRTFTATS